MKWAIFSILLCIGCVGEIQRPNLELFDHDVSFEELPTTKTEWKQMGKKIQNFGTGRPSLWIRSKIKNDSDLAKNLVLEIGVAYLDEIHYYLLQNENITYQKSGVFSQKIENGIDHRHPNFHISLNPGEEVFVYFKIRNSGLLTFPIRIWEQKDFINKSQGEYIIHGLYFGAMLSMLFYNLLIFITLREKSFLYYCFYICSAFFVYFILGGFQKQFFFHDSNFMVKPALFTASYLSIASVLLFTAEFLNLSFIQKTFNRALTNFAYFCLLLVFLSPFLPFTWMVRSMNYLLPFGSLLMIVSALIAYQKGIGQSSFFLLAWIIVTIGVILETMVNLDILPMEFWLGRFGTQLSSLLEGILFSIAIGRRIRSLTKEKENMKAKLLLIEKDLEVARKIQNRILPLHNPTLRGANIHVSYIPLRAVGGDFYDFHELDEDKFGVLVADVTGHGVSAAMDSSTVKIAFKNEKPWFHSPEKLLSYMNDFLVEALDQRFVSAVYAFIDLKSLEMIYATAGHPPILLIRNNQIIELESEGFLLGFQKNCKYVRYKMKLFRKDKLLFYTDGLNDNISIEKNPTEVLRETMEKIPFINPEQYTNELISILNIKRLTDSDDITALLIDLK